MKKILLFLGIAAIVCVLGRINTIIIKPVNAEIKLKKVEYAAPILKRICSCESWGSPDKEPRQFDRNGNVLRGSKNPEDTGGCQLNIPTWGAKAKEIGYDVNTYSGNVSMANYIYKREGTAPWNASKSCWAKT